MPRFLVSLLIRAINVFALLIFSLLAFFLITINVEVNVKIKIQIFAGCSFPDSCYFTFTSAVIAMFLG